MNAGICSPTHFSHSEFVLLSKKVLVSFRKCSGKEKERKRGKKKVREDGWMKGKVVGGVSKAVFP